MRLRAIAVLGSFAIMGSCTVGCGQNERGASLPVNETATATRQEAAQPAAAAAAPTPEFRELTLPVGTELAVVLDTAVASDTSRREEPVSAHLAQGVVAEGTTALPAGSSVTGLVTSAVRSGKVKGRAQLALRFDSVAPKGEAERYDIVTSPVSRTARSTERRDAAEIGLPAIGGAVVGGLVGGKKGAIIGGAAGGGAGTAVVLNQRGEEVRLGPGATFRVRLEKPLTVRVPRT